MANETDSKTKETNTEEKRSVEVVAAAKDIKVIDPKIQPYVDVLEKYIKEKSLENDFSPNQILDMAKTLDKNKFSLPPPTYDVAKSGPHYSTTCVAHMIDNAVYYSANASPPKENAFMQFLQDASKDPKFEERMKSVIVKGLAKIVRTQDTNQMYHTVLHALEMNSDSRNKMGALVGDKDAPIAIFAGALAALHDAVQGVGQYRNEKESADVFNEIFAEEFKKPAQPDQNNPNAVMADQNTLNAIQSVSNSIIVEGTLLNMNAADPKKTPLLVIQHDLLKSIDIKVPSDSAQESIELAASVLSSNDVHRAANQLSFDGPLSLAKMPKVSEDALRDTLFKGLINSGDFDETKGEATAFLNKFFPSFEILIGQNIRMLSDGPWRKFRDNDITIQNNDGTASQASSMEMLKDHFADARLNASGSNPPKPQVIAILAKSLKGEADFGMGMNSLEIAEMYKADSKDNLSNAVKNQMILMDVQGEPMHAWAAHAKYFLPTLSTALNSDSTKKSELVEGMLFSAANQAGFIELCRDKTLLTDLAKDLYKIDTPQPEKLTATDARVLATTFMSLSQDPKANQLLKAVSQLEKIQSPTSSEKQKIQEIQSELKTYAGEKYNEFKQKVAPVELKSEDNLKQTSNVAANIDAFKEYKSEFKSTVTTLREATQESTATQDSTAENTRALK